MEDTQVTTVKPEAPKTLKAPKAPKGPARTSSPAAGCLAVIFNLLSLVFVLLSCLSAALIAVLFQFPSVLTRVPGGSALLAPTQPAIAQVVSLPTAAAGTPESRLSPLPAAWTPTDIPTITPTPQPGTPTPVPSGTLAVPTYTSTSTVTPTSTATKPSPTPTRTGPTPTPTVTHSLFTFDLQAGSPTYLSNFLNNAGCNWFGIVGRAFGSDKNPVINLTVHLEGGGISTDVLTGTGPSALGPGGYQIPISDHPIDTTDTYHIRLRNNTGTALSDVYAIRTFGDCSKNAVMVNFVQNH